MMMTIDRSAAQLMHVLGYIYAHHGQSKRGLVLLLIAAQLAPDDVPILRTLAHTFLIDGSPSHALAVLDRLRGMEGADHPVLELLTGRALWACGRHLEARRAFDDFIERRNGS
jgi:type III secretion protein Y